jgi:hypothetical protein
MDLGTTSRSWGVDDTSWLASRKGLDTCRSVTLDMSTFTKATHYPDGFLPSGLPLAPVGTDGLYGLATGSVVEGHLRGVVHVPDPAPAKAGAALQWEGVVDCRFLPVDLTAAQAAAATHIRYENAPTA